MIRKINEIPLVDVEFEADSTKIAAYLAQSYSGYESISIEHIQHIVREKKLEYIDVDSIDVASVELQYHDMCRLFSEIEDIYRWTQRRDVHILQEKIQRIYNFANSEYRNFLDGGIEGVIASEAGVPERPVARCSQIYADFVQYILGYDVCAADVYGNVMYWKGLDDHIDFPILSKEEIESHNEWNRFKRAHDGFNSRRV